MTMGRLTQQLLASTGFGSGQIVLAPDGSSANTGSRKAKISNKYLALEPRMMFDGALAATVERIVAESVEPTFDHDHSADQDSQQLLNALSADQPIALHSDIRVAEVLPGVVPSISQPLVPVQIVFVDSAVKDPGAIYTAIPAGTEIVGLVTGTDGLDQIARYLAGRSDVAAVHIISHGVEAEFILGGMKVDQAALATHAADLAVIKSAMTAHGDILLYGCDVAKGSDGAAFVDALAAATGADVAASSDKTGAANLGGNWSLEVRHGLIEAGLLDAREWNGLLAPLVISVATAPTLSGTSGVGPYGFVQGTVGEVALWVNAGTIGGTSIDIRATVTANAGGKFHF